MEHETTLEKELTIRKYIIFPSREHIVIMRRTDDKYGSKSISVTVDFSECKFFVIKNSGEQISFVSSFNETLLEFLGIPATHTFLIQGALGYNPKSLEQSVARDRSFSILSTREAPVCLQQIFFMLVQRINAKVIVRCSCPRARLLTKAKKSRSCSPALICH
jgi:hypothetical protein